MVKEEVKVSSITNAKELSEKLDTAYHILCLLKQEVSELEKAAVPVYDHYKPFKEVGVGKKFAFGCHILMKREIINMVGNSANALDLESSQYTYIGDYEWVVELD